MNGLKELLKRKGKDQRFGDYCRSQLEDTNYVRPSHSYYRHAPTYEMFGLDPMAEGVPHILVDEVDYVVKQGYTKDAYGNKVAGQVYKEPMMTGRKVWVVSPKYLEMIQYMREKGKSYQMSTNVMRNLPDNAIQNQLI
jgi:hypothetical protein